LSCRRAVAEQQGTPRTDRHNQLCARSKRAYDFAQGLRIAKDLTASLPSDPLISAEPGLVTATVSVLTIADTALIRDSVPYARPKKRSVRFALDMEACMGKVCHF
jgi:hypothetical protein